MYLGGARCCEPGHEFCMYSGGKVGKVMYSGGKVGKVMYSGGKVGKVMYSGGKVGKVSLLAARHFVK